MESLLNLNELLQAVKGVSVRNKQNCYFDSVATDSRDVKENTMFVPLIGLVQDGHKYIEQSVQKGASVVLLNKSEYYNKKDYYEKLALENEKLVLVAVENTLYALQAAAEAYVQKFPDLIKVSITGSSGKTTTKELMVSVAKAYFGDDFTVYTKGNFNSETGLPLSVFNIRKQHKIGIFEMGMNRVNEIGEISKVLKSKYGIITNIGTAHIGILKSQENIALEKRKSFDYIPADGAAIVPKKDSFADFCCENVKGKIVKFGMNVSEEESGVTFVKDNGLLGTSFKVDGVLVNLPLPGKYNYEDALSVVACAKQIGIPAESIKSGIENVAKISGRMEIIKSKIEQKKEIYIIKDCYNANLDSMVKSIEFCAELDSTFAGKKLCVLGDMKELGSESEKSHKAVGQCLLKYNFDYVFFVGPEMKAALETVKTKMSCEWYEENSDVVFGSITKKIREVACSGDVVLFKASHSMNFEQLVEKLSNGGGK